MIEDLERAAGHLTLDADVCIIGSGAAGLVLATELMATTLRVVLLESGGMALEKPSQKLYESEIADHTFNGHLVGRFRTFGGSTTQWGGEALPFSPLDFEARDWVPFSGWPIRCEELARHYARAGRFIMIDALRYEGELFRLLRLRPPAFVSDGVQYHFSKWSPKPDLWQVHRPALRRAENLTVLLHANLMRLELAGSLDHVQSAHVRSLGGRTATVRARYFALCTGGLEVARILLYNNTQLPHGIGNARDLVGRYFQDHVAATIGELRPTDERKIQYYFNTFYHDGLKYLPRLSLSPETQRRERVLNVSGWVAFHSSDNADYVAAKEAYVMMRRRRFNREWLGKVCQALRGLPSLAVPAYHYLVRQHAYSPNAVPHVNIICEQEPNPDSRITLAKECDALGLPRSRICWRLTEMSRHAIGTYARLVQTEFARLGLGQLMLEDWVGQNADGWQEHVSDIYHHMGTARMGDSPINGVVNADCQVYGVDNLFIGGSAVFPSSSHSNPTFTLLALAFRLADFLRQRLQCA